MELSYNLQYGDSNFDEVDDRGVASPAEILSAFDRFDWKTEIAKANQHQKCSPTFSVLSTNPKGLFWVSAFGDPDDFQFVSSFSRSLGMHKGWFGLVEKERFDAPNCRQDVTLDEARAAVEFFVKGQDENVRKIVTAA